MASTFVVPIVELKNIRQHPNADKLELADVLGYQMCIVKGQHTENEKVVYFPSGTIIPDVWSVKFGVKNFLRGKEKNRVGQIRLRGEPSFGLVAPIPEDVNWEVGDNVCEYFDCTKYEPPIRATAGDAIAWDDEIDPFFKRYTSIENGRIFTDIFEDGETVIASEKVHGTNCKLGLIKGVKVAGSMGRGEEHFTGRRKEPESYKANTYWYPWSIETTENMINELYKEAKDSVLVYGEVFGGSVQSLNYGIPKGQGLGFRAFDINIDGKYLDVKQFIELCTKYDVPMVPVIYEGPFDMNVIKEHSSGQSTIADHIREGVVVKPLSERNHPKIGRVILKFIGTEYELSKHKEKDTTDI